MRNDRLEPQRILIVRLSAMGDVVMASGLIPSIRRLYPTAHLAWLCEDAVAPLLRTQQMLDEVIVWPRPAWQALWRQRAWLQLLGQARAFRRLLRDHRFDVVIDAHGLLKSGVLAWMTGAPRRVGLMPREGSHLLVHEKVEPPAGPPIIGSEYRFLARHLGAPASDYRLTLEPGEAATRAARLALEKAGIGERPLAVLCPFTTRPQKHWFEDRWAALADALHSQGLQPIVLGGPGDKEAAARLSAASAPLVSMAGLLKLDESIALIGQSQLLVGVDTGLTHAGTALRVPTVALFGSTRPYLQTDSPRTAILYEPLHCSPCRRNPTCAGAFDCMKLHTVQRVLSAALAQWRGSGA